MESMLQVLFGMLQDELANAIAGHDLDTIEQVLNIADMAGIPMFPEQMETVHMTVDDARDYLDMMMELETEDE